ncbi:MAG: glycosyltransferase family 2 protein [Pseudomonadota bacterium]
MDSQKKPKVSIGIPTYNRADGLLREALESALSQTYENIEIVVSDNCSTDSTPDFMASFDDPRLRYIRQEQNLGPNGNFNACLTASTGDYFILLCDDDALAPDMVESCMRAIDYDPTFGVVRCGARVFDENGRTIYERRNVVKNDSLEAMAMGWFDKTTAIYLSSTVFNTAELKRVGGLTSMHNLLEDSYGIARVCRALRMANIPDVKASFRRYPAQRTHFVPIREWCEDYIGLLDEFTIDMPERRAAEIKSRGRKYFCGLCLTRVEPIASPIRRLVARFNVYRLFGFRYAFGRMKARMMRSVRGVFAPQVVS